MLLVEALGVMVLSCRDWGVERKRHEQGVHVGAGGDVASAK